VECEEVVRKRDHIRRAFAERRQRDRENREPVVEIFAKAPIDCVAEKVAVARGHDAHIDVPAVRAADPAHLALLERVQQPFELVASLDDSETARDMRELLTTIQSLRSDKITLRTDGNDARKPSFSMQRLGAANSLRFAGLPLGHEFTSLVLALLWTGGHPPKIEAPVRITRRYTWIVCVQWGSLNPEIGLESR